MNQDFTQSRWFYLELAKLKHNREWTMICLSNVLRIMNKEKATAETVTR